MRSRDVAKLTITLGNLNVHLLSLIDTLKNVKEELEWMNQQGPSYTLAMQNDGDANGPDQGPECRRPAALRGDS